MMGAHLAISGVWLQGADVASSDSMKVLTWAVCLIAFCSFVQFCVVVGAAFAGWKAYQSTQKALAEVKSKAFPIVASVQRVIDDARPKVASITESVRGIVEDARPKIASVTENVRSIVDDATPKVKVMTENVKTVSANVAETSTTLKDKAREIADNVTETVGEANKKTRAQVDRVDNIVSSAFNATSEVATKIHHGIKVPVNEVVGWVNGLKAGLDRLLSKKKTAATAKPDRGGAGPAETEPGLASTPRSGSAAGAGASFPDERAFGADRFQAAATLAAEQDVLADPSSAVAPSPGAQEVVDRFLRNQDADEKPKPVY